MRIFLLGPALLLTFMAQDDRWELTGGLDGIVREYRAVSPPKDIESLVRLDLKLRHHLEEPFRKSSKGFNGSWWKASWSEIGVTVGHYSDQLQYSGKLLIEAHRIDPASPFRRFTLFSTILGEGTSHGLGEMPDVRAALEYLKEFPEGPFVDQTLIILGFFYDDLFKVCRGLQRNDLPEYKLNCFSKYVRKTDVDGQAREAQRLAIRYYSQALDLNRESRSDWFETQMIKRYKRDVETDKAEGWHFCAD
jgi:hypothetical protein